ncbi:hypothetical protein B0H13DRAFT_2015713, partial [Mycena leptocephala]
AAALPAQVTLPAVFPSQSGIPNAVVLGVDSQGHTTYGIEQTEIDGTSTIPFTATMVAGADHAGFTFSATGDGFTVVAGFDCDLPKNGGAGAVCSDMAGSKAETITVSSALPSFVIDVVSTAAPSGATNKPNSSPRLAVAASVYGLWVSMALVVTYGLCL